MTDQTKPTPPAKPKAVKGDAPTTVTVACKHPPGIFMQAYQMEDYEVPVLGGGTRTAKRAVPVGERIKIHGPAVPFGRVPHAQIVRGYAMTSGVPAETANQWLEQNKDSPLVKGGIVFISTRTDNAVAKAKDLGPEVRSNLEQLDPTMVTKNDRKVPRDSRWPGRTNPNLTTIDTDKRDDVAA